MNAEPGTVPFAISFDRAGNLVIAEAGTNSLATFALNHDGTVTQLIPWRRGRRRPVGSRVNGLFYASNAGSGS